MNTKVLKSEKNLIEIELDSLTVAEILREYLQKDSAVEFAAWRREHPTKPMILKVETKGKDVKKAIADAVALIEKESNKLVDAVKKIWLLRRKFYSELAEFS